MTFLCLDTSALLALLAREARAEWVAQRLDQADHLLVCPAVVAELRPSLTQPEDWLESSGVAIDWELDREVWRRVGDLHADYALRRRQSGGGWPRRIVTDFLIGAHAEVGGHALLTLNPADYSFLSQLTLVTP